MSVSVRNTALLALWSWARENGELETLVVESLSFTRVAEPTGEEPIPVTASLDLAIYTQLTTSE